jgi:hypothetical protein
MPLLTLNTCPSACRKCISRAFHGMSAGGKTTSNPAATHCLWTSSTSSTHTDIHTPLSAVSSPSDPNVELFAPLPRPPCAPRQRKISHSPDPTLPKVGGVPQSQHFFQPHFSNHAKLAAMSDTFKIGVMCFASMARKHNTPVEYCCRCPLLAGGVYPDRVGARVGALSSVISISARHAGNLLMQSPTFRPVTLSVFSATIPRSANPDYAITQ